MLALLNIHFAWILPNKFLISPTNVLEVILEEFKDCCIVDQIPKPNNFINLECSYYLTAIYQVSSYTCIYASSVGDVEYIMR